MEYLPHTRYYLGFNLVAGVGAVRLARLIEQCGSVEAAWHASPTAMAKAGLDAKTNAALAHAQSTLDLDAKLEQFCKAGIDLITLEDATYPHLLAQIPNPPPLLYLRGTLSPFDEWAVAIVGTRSPTSYGKEATRQIGSGLARQRVTIVSGLAMGIDSVAHKTALEAGGRTIAVLGSGVDVIYPERNEQLATEIIENGAIISEYAPGTRPNALNFPPRNRIISGLALATLVVEGGIKSGALITSSFAADHGRDVFAVPGSIFSKISEGPNNLIRNGAGLVTNAEDILQALNLLTAPIQQEVSLAMPDDPTEAKLLTYLSKEPQHADLICRASGLTTSLVLSTLGMLELKGYIRQVGNMEYVRSR